MECTIYVVKTKVLISCAVTAPLFSNMQKAGFLMTRLILPFLQHALFALEAALPEWFQKLTVVYRHHCVFY